jgi:probable O-glycosylation ligase (exosortase A-associated)
MRDVALTLIVFGSIPFILARPYLGVLMYVWLSVMNPHRLTWSFAHDIPFVAIVAVATLAGVLFTRHRKPIPITPLTCALFAFIGWVTITTVFSAFPTESYALWTAMMKTQLMVLMIPVLFYSRENARRLIWVVVLSLAYYGTKGGIWTLLTGGHYRIYGPEGSYIEDNNALAAVLVMTIPIMRYLQVTTTRRSASIALTVMMIASGISVLGSYSRGAFLAVVVMLSFLWLKGRHKLSLTLAGILVIPLALMYMPEQWYKRMDTIETYQQDSSARMRLNAWGTMFNIAKDHPVLGAGFEVAQKEIYDRYSPDPSFPPQVAHSIYFEVLGEHGFVGLVLYLLLLGAHWQQAGRLVRKTRDRADLAWAGYYGRMMQVSLVGFAVGGAFLSLVNFDIPYYLVGVTVVVARLLEQQLANEREEAAAGPVKPSVFSSRAAEA